ncbi:glycosyltransferase family 39 protein [Desulfococcaceae bacterium HSG7]|nr:glycosyltransferase family 39 protein [Desulfococcaceae bacterium HSG7]
MKSTINIYNTTENTNASIRYFQKYYVVIIFFIAFIIRFMHLNCYIANPAFDFPLGGYAAYVKTALIILEGDILGGDHIFYDNSPIYSYILATLFKLFGIDFYVVRFIQILLGSLNCCLIAFLARHFFGIIPSFIAGVIASFFGPLIFYDAEIIVLSWVICFCLIALIILVTSKIENQGKIFIAGIFIGFAIMGRPNLILFPVLMIFFFIFHNTRSNLSTRVKTYSLLWMGILVIMSPFIIRNYAVSGEIIFLNPSGGHNFYLAHHPDATPYFSEQYRYKGAIYLKYKEIAENEMQRPLSSKETSAFWYKKGLRFIFANPLMELKLIWEKAKFFFNDLEMPTYFNYYFSKNYSFILKYGVISFGFIFPLSVLGFISTIHRHKKLLPLYLFFGTTFLSVLIIFVISRLRIPAIPVLIIFAGYGVFVVIKWLQLRAYKPLSLAVAIGASLYIATFVPLAKIGYAGNYNHTGVIQWQKGNISEAEGCFLKALELQGNYEYALLNLIRMYELRGDSEKEAAYRQQYKTWQEKYKRMPIRDNDS